MISNTKRGLQITPLLRKSYFSYLFNWGSGFGKADHACPVREL
jgi:hypothetical protein